MELSPNERGVVCTERRVVVSFGRELDGGAVGGVIGCCLALDIAPDPGRKRGMDHRTQGRAERHIFSAGTVVLYAGPFAGRIIRAPDCPARVCLVQHVAGGDGQTSDLCDAGGISAAGYLAIAAHIVGSPRARPLAVDRGKVGLLAANCNFFDCGLRHAIGGRGHYDHSPDPALANVASALSFLP